MLNDKKIKELTPEDLEQIEITELRQIKERMLGEEKKSQENVFKKAYKKLDHTERTLRENY